MKRTTMLRLFSVATAASAAIFFTSCGDKKDSDGGGDDSTTEEKVDTADSLTDELIVQMNVLADAMASAKDKASAEEAVKKINGVGDEFVSIAERLDKLETPSEEKQTELEAKMEKAAEEMQKKIQGSMGAIMSNPDVGAVLGPAMMEFGKRMETLDPVFERFGKKKEGEGGAE